MKKQLETMDAHVSKLLDIDQLVRILNGLMYNK